MLLTLVTLLPTREEVCGGNESQRFVPRCVPLLPQRPIACCCGRRHICSSSSHPLTLRPLHPQHPLCCTSISATLRRRRRQRLAASMRWYESLPPPFAVTQPSLSSPCRKRCDVRHNRRSAIGVAAGALHGHCRSHNCSRSRGASKAAAPPTSAPRVG